MNKDSTAQPAAPEAAGPTLDSWAWVARARAAARQARESSMPPAEARDELDAQPRDSAAD